MKNILWAGPCSREAWPLKDYVESSKSEVTPRSSLNHLNGRNIPHIIISEDWNELFLYSQKYSNSIQIFIATAKEITETFQQSIRPLNRYFFAKDNQSLNEFRELIYSLENKKNNHKKSSSFFGPITSMQNSLEVLKQLTEQRLFELRNFSHKEDDRRKNFQSLIHLARRFSMSRDIEEVVQSFWNDIKGIEGLKSVAILLIDPSGKGHKIIPKSGKFHFQEITTLSPLQIDFFESLIPNRNTPDVCSLEETKINALNFLLQQQYNFLLGCRLNSESSDRTIFVFVETKLGWHRTKTFDEFFLERLPLVHLTLEKHLLQEEIKSKAKLWATTFDDLEDPLAIVRKNKLIVRANRQFQALDGSHLKNTWNNHVHQERVELNANSQNSSTEIQLNGRIFQSRFFPIQDIEKNENDAFVAHYVDVTTERVLYSQLIQSEKMSAVGQLAGDLSEALSVPLKKIVHCSEKLLAVPNLVGQTRTDAEEIRKAAHRSLRIIDDFENFSRGHIEKNLVMAETVVDKTIPLVKALLHGHRFNLQLSETKHLINVSFSLIQQVLYNLLRNAHQAMKGQGELIISTEPWVLNQQSGVRIAVLDSGPGVPLEMREKLFQPFVTSKGASDGVGLGLNIVKQIIESHGGMVGYEPRNEGGSKFWLWIPVAKESLE
ncbi:MAG: hypothetical protein RJB66_2040 [Pseudomonadota bacterium]|jgi:signal transduction histidine kinase